MTALQLEKSARPDRRTRMTSPVLWGAATLGAVGLLHVRDPHQSGSYGFCPWLLLTGTYCPGCGGLRAVNDLTEGEFVGALSSNVVVVLGVLPLAVYLWARWVRARWRGEQFTSRWFSARVLTLWGVGLVAWAVVRNLEFAHWLAP